MTTATHTLDWRQDLCAYVTATPPALICVRRMPENVRRALARGTDDDHAQAAVLIMSRLACEWRGCDAEDVLQALLDESRGRDFGIICEAAGFAGPLGMALSMILEER